MIALSVVLVMKGGLERGTVNYDTKTMYQLEPELYLIKKDIPGETTDFKGFRSSRS